MAQWFTETPYLPAAGVKTYRVAMWAPQRIYIGFFLPTPSATLNISTNPNVSSSTGISMGTGTSGLNVLERWASRHGILAAAEWWVETAALGPGPFITVAEVYDDSFPGPPTSAPRGSAVIPGVLLSDADSPEPVHRLLQAHRRSLERLRNARS
jgi:hypothetical protein